MLSASTVICPSINHYFVEIHASASGYYKLGSIVAVIGNFYTTHHHHVHAPDLGECSRYENKCRLE
uniref:Uncharacterized protein n=2 Tax=Aegilops tauschii subsp. strangulata TaxID=200361 RepID=A0A453RYC7_AEGTS